MNSALPPPHNGAMTQENYKTGRAEKTVLFLCGHNAGRSLMAEAWFNARNRNPGVVALSAGTDPAGEVNPQVRALLEAEGISTARLRPKALDASLLGRADEVYTMGCNVSTTDVPCDKLRGDLGLDDPHGQDEDAVRRIFEQLKQKLAPLIGDAKGSE